MIPAYKFEKEMGIEYFFTDSSPLLGVIKYKVEDFIVEEVLKDHTILSLTYPIKLNLPNKGDYLYTVVVKKNLNLNELISALTNKFKINSSLIGISGIKDKRAITVQLISLKNLRKEDIKNIQFKRIKFLTCAYSYGPLRRGVHLGNYFTVLIRGIKLSKEKILNEINKILNFLKTNSLPNYFGYQRFGIPRPYTHEIGKNIILKDYEKAVELILGHPDPLEPEENKIARKIYDETKDVEKMLKCLPENLFYEKLILEHLLHHPKDYLGALSKLPASVIKLFLEAYSSYIFNKLLSKRIKLIQNNLENGDLISPLDSYTPVYYAFEIGQKISKKRALELIKKNKFALVLPMIGFKVKLGGGFLRELIREILIEEYVRPLDFKVKLENKAIGLKGAYRRVDLPILFKVNYSIKEDEIFGNYALQLKFCLVKGCYATIFLREFMKHNYPGAYIGKYLT